MSCMRGWTLWKEIMICIDGQHRYRDRKDVQQVRVIEDGDGNVLTSEKSAEKMEVIVWEAEKKGGGGGNWRKEVGKINEDEEIK